MCPWTRLETSATPKAPETGSFGFWDVRTQGLDALSWELLRHVFPVAIFTIKRGSPITATLGRGGRWMYLTNQGVWYASAS